MPRLSVIIANYNHAAYLNTRIDSVLNQTYQDFEVIILDDCSTDNSREILENYRSNAKISHIIYNPINSGSTFRQWEKGIIAAKGEYIWMAESDDIMDSSFLEKAIGAFNYYPSVGLFQCSSSWIDEDGKQIKSYNHSNKSEVTSGKQFILEHLISGCAIYNASAVVFKKQFVDLPLKEMTEYKYCGDWLFWVKILEKSDIFYSNEKLNSFRRHRGNVSGISEKRGLFFLEGIKVYGYIKRIYPDSFNWLNTYDRRWVKMFVARKFDLNITFRFLKTSFKYGYLFPVYYYGYRTLHMLRKASKYIRNIVKRK